MKAFATEAKLMADGDLKLYQIKWVDSHGNENEDTVKGKDMQSALKSVLRQKQRDRLESLPMFVYLLAAVLIVASFAMVAMISQAPLVSMMGGAFLLGFLYMLLDKYFQFTETKS
jgi:hypothetical protein